MADIELVIKIPEEMWKRVKEGYVPLGISKYLRSGIPLPKGHGRLVDADKLKKVYDERITYLYILNKKDNPSLESKICGTNWCNNTIDELPTIVEADKEI